ncbi:MAG TPA: exopolysaccharide biosynthesis protein [Phycisphaerae bacterium]|nr:exopolysaccharide biosynthesis protein [Phycisphaerae bacterium]
MAAPDPQDQPPRQPRLLRLSALLSELAANVHKSPAQHGVTIGELVDHAAQAGFGFVIALLALVSIPLPGFSLPFGLAIAVGAVQMIAGRRRVWLPARVRRFPLSQRTLGWIERRVCRWSRGLERLVRPRLAFLVNGPGWMTCGGGVLVLAIGLALPLPIPLSNLVFIVPLLVYAVGLLENDGLLVMLAHGTVVVLAGLGAWFARELLGLLQWALGAVL